MMSNSPRQRGFSMIEIMIGLLIGMVSVIVILQIFSRSDAAKRITNGNDDAQLNATLTLHSLSREVRQAGWGVNAFGLLGCSLSYTTSADSAAVTLPALAPVIINSSLIPAGDANTDTLLVVSGNAPGPGEGDPTTATSVAGSFNITTPSTYAVNDYVVATPATRPSPCALTLFKITAITASRLTVTTGVAGLDAGSLIYNLGSAPRVMAYAVRNGNLTQCDYRAYNCGSTSYTTTLNSDVWIPVGSNVVSLRAQYGRDTSGITGSTSVMTGVVNSFDQITPGTTADTTTIPVQCRWARILGVRMVAVGLSTHFDRDAPTTDAPTWSGTTAVTTASSSVTILNPTALPINLSSVSNWQNHRYRVMESAIPLRNMIWQGSQATYQGGGGGC